MICNKETVNQQTFFMLMVSRTASIVIIIHDVYVLMKLGVQMTEPPNCLFIYLIIVKLSIVNMWGSFSEN